MWLCKCDCGKERVALGYDLTHGRTVSCGCKNADIVSPLRQDISGQKFGTLTAISINEDRTRPGHIFWNCVCDCGEKTVVNIGNLKNGHTKSHKGCRLKSRSYNYLDLTGKRFGRLVVMEIAEKQYDHETWLCKCDCGNEKIISKRSLLSGSSRSCGCLLDETRKKPNRITHNLSKTRIYKEFYSMRSRCKRDSPCHKNYYEKGISVCDEWSSENGFEAFLNWSLLNGYNDGLTLDRIDNNGNYEPSNCRWVTYKEQQNNKSTNVYIHYCGETKTLKQWSEYLNLSYGMLKARHRLGIKPPELFEKSKRNRDKEMAS